MLNILQFYTNIVTPKRMKKCGGAHVKFTLTESVLAGSTVSQFAVIRISFHWIQSNVYIKTQMHRTAYFCHDG